MAVRVSTCVGLFALLFLKGCLAVQTWNQEPSRTEVNPKGSVVLSCKIYNMQGECSWQKDGKPQGMFSGKYEWAGDRSSGDCSIRIFDAGEVDDGDWECQVTASSFTAHDALTSRIAQLVVRVAPRQPQLEVETQQVLAGHNFTVTEDMPASIRCLSRFGNPAADIKWFIGDEELPAEEYDQSNATESERINTWMAVSRLQHVFTKADHDKALRCVAVHQAYQTKSMATEALMDVQYAPTVRLEGAPSTDLMEDEDSVALRCVVDANPPGNVVWRVLGDTDVFSFTPEVRFAPASRSHSATYTCEARNAVGASDPLSVKIDVKYPPRVLRVGPAQGPDYMMTVALHNHTMLECMAEGNPPPKYTWVQTVADSDEVLVRGTEKNLVLESVGYEHQGRYMCLVSNTIKGQENEDASTPITLQVVGAPQVLRYTVDKSVQVEKGEEAVIQVVFCSDPQPLRITWEWGSNQLDVGNGRGRYVADNLAQQDTREDCYRARLRVQQADMTDERDYILSVQNERGADRYAVGLMVHEPVAMTTVIAVIVACIVVVVIVIGLCLYAFKSEKWCFSQRGDFKPTDLESDKSDIESQKETNDNANTNGNTKLVPGNEKQQQLQQQQQPIGEKR